jgi:hypothetical protein
MYNARRTFPKTEENTVCDAEMMAMYVWVGSGEGNCFYTLLQLSIFIPPQRQILWSMVQLAMAGR